MSDAFDWVGWMESNHVSLTPVLKRKSKRNDTVTVIGWYAGRKQIGADGWTNVVAMKHNGVGATAVDALKDLKDKMDSLEHGVSNYWKPSDGV